jgi:hypothetical protein
VISKCYCRRLKHRHVLKNPRQTQPKKKKKKKPFYRNDDTAFIIKIAVLSVLIIILLSHVTQRDVFYQV